MLALADRIDALNTRIGHALSWLAILLILVQFTLVVMSSIFYTGSVWLQESVLYINALIFLGGAGYTLAVDKHVRVDFIYSARSAGFRTRVNFWGTLLLLLPVVGLLFWKGGPYALDAWANRQGSIETAGIQAVFVLKSFVLVFAVTLGLQAISMAIRTIAELRNGD